MDRRTFMQAGSAIAALPALSFAQPLTTVTIQIDGAAVPFYAPLYAALEKGIFRKYGIDAKFLYANASEIAKNVAAGNIEFGYPNADAVIAARASDIPVKVIHTTYQRSIGATLFKQSSGIKTFADLKGKRVAVTSLGSPNYLQLQAGLKQVGLTINDVKLDVIATGAIVQALQADQCLLYPSDASAESRVVSHVWTRIPKTKKPNTDIYSCTVMNSFDHRC